VAPGRGGKKNGPLFESVKKKKFSYPYAKVQKVHQHFPPRGRGRPPRILKERLTVGKNLIRISEGRRRGRITLQEKRG